MEGFSWPDEYSDQDFNLNLFENDPTQLGDFGFGDSTADDIIEEAEQGRWSPSIFLQTETTVASSVSTSAQTSQSFASTAPVTTVANNLVNALTTGSVTELPREIGNASPISTARPSPNTSTVKLVQQLVVSQDNTAPVSVPASSKAAGKTSARRNKRNYGAILPQPASSANANVVDSSGKQIPTMSKKQGSGSTQGSVDVQRMSTVSTRGHMVPVTVANSQGDYSVISIPIQGSVLQQGLGQNQLILRGQPLNLGGIHSLQSGLGLQTQGKMQAVQLVRTGPDNQFAPQLYSQGTSQNIVLSTIPANSLLGMQPNIQQIPHNPIFITNGQTVHQINIPQNFAVNRASSTANQTVGGNVLNSNTTTQNHMIGGLSGVNVGNHIQNVNILTSQAQVINVINSTDNTLTNNQGSGGLAVNLGGLLQPNPMQSQLVHGQFVGQSKSVANMAAQGKATNVGVVATGNVSHMGTRPMQIHQQMLGNQARARAPILRPNTPNLLKISPDSEDFKQLLRQNPHLAEVLPRHMLQASGAAQNAGQAQPVSGGGQINIPILPNVVVNQKAPVGNAVQFYRPLQAVVASKPTMQQASFANVGKESKGSKIQPNVNIQKQQMVEERIIANNGVTIATQHEMKTQVVQHTQQQVLQQVPQKLPQQAQQYVQQHVQQQQRLQISGSAPILLQSQIPPNSKSNQSVIRECLTQDDDPPSAKKVKLSGIPTYQPIVSMPTSHLQSSASAGGGGVVGHQSILRNAQTPQTYIITTMNKPVPALDAAGNPQPSTSTGAGTSFNASGHPQKLIYPLELADMWRKVNLHIDALAKPPHTQERQEKLQKLLTAREALSKHKHVIETGQAQLAQQAQNAGNYSIATLQHGGTVVNVRVNRPADRRTSSPAVAMQPVSQQSMQRMVTPMQGLSQVFLTTQPGMSSGIATGAAFLQAGLKHPTANVQSIVKEEPGQVATQNMMMPDPIDVTADVARQKLEPLINSLPADAKLKLSNQLAQLSAEERDSYYKRQWRTVSLRMQQKQQQQLAQQGFLQQSPIADSNVTIIKSEAPSSVPSLKPAQPFTIKVGPSINNASPGTSSLNAVNMPPHVLATPQHQLTRGVLSPLTPVTPGKVPHSKVVSVPRPILPAPPALPRSVGSSPATRLQPSPRTSMGATQGCSVQRVNKSQLFQFQLSKDQKCVLNPDIHTPFVDYHDQIKRLLKYHVWQTTVEGDTEEPPDEDEEEKQEFERFSSEVENKFGEMLAKYQMLMNKEAMCISPSAEMVMIDRMFISDERQALEEDKKERLKETTLEAEQKAAAGGDTVPSTEAKEPTVASPHSSGDKPLGKLSFETQFEEFVRQSQPEASNSAINNNSSLNSSAGEEGGVLAGLLMQDECNEDEMQSAIDSILGLNQDEYSSMNNYTLLDAIMSGNYLGDDELPGLVDMDLTPQDEDVEAAVNSITD